MGKIGVREDVPARVGRGALRKIELNGHNLLKEETILFEKNEREKVKTQTKQVRSSKAVESM